MSQAILLYKAKVNELVSMATAGNILFKDKWYSADVYSCTLIAGWVSHIASGGTLPAGFTWRSVDNTDVDVTSDDMVNINGAIIQRSNVLRQLAIAAKADLDTVSSVEEADAIINDLIDKISRV